MNAPDRQLAPLGLDEASLQAINPGVIFCQLDCFGGPRRGPRTDYLGYDDLIQATTGIMLRFGGGMATPEEHAHVGTIDVMCGFGAALGIAAALLQKKRTGRIGRPRTSLSALSGLAQIPFCYHYQGRAPFDEPAGREATGYHALHRVYRTGDDGFLLLAASEADLPRLETILAFKGLSARSEEARVRLLSDAFAAAPLAFWLDRLRAVDVGAAPCDTMEAIRSAATRPADGLPGTAKGSYAFSLHADHPSGHVVTQLDPYAVRTARSRVTAPAPAERYGVSTRAVLRTLGRSEAVIDSLAATGVVSEAWSREYLPS